jgi:hypothetical protein
MGLIAIGLYFQYNRGLASTLNSDTDTTTTNSSSVTPVTSDPTDDVFTATNTERVVKVYDSGAGEAVVADVLNQLKQGGYETENLGKSQFEYDKTYIWHTPTFTDTAQAIGLLLAGRQVGLRESQIAGVFDVLIYLGKQ